jgi:hypothetical protein
MENDYQRLAADIDEPADDDVIGKGLEDDDSFDEDDLEDDDEDEEDDEDED